MVTYIKSGLPHVDSPPPCRWAAERWSPHTMLTDTHLIMEAPHQLLGPPDEYTNNQTAHHRQNLHADANNSPSVDEVAVLLGRVMTRI